MRIVIFGGRRYGNTRIKGKSELQAARERAHVRVALDRLTAGLSDVTILILETRGASLVAKQWSTENGIECIATPRAILSTDLVLAFPGNAKARDRAKHRGAWVIEAAATRPVAVSPTPAFSQQPIA